MKKFRELPFSEKIKWRIRALWLVLVLMIVYMVALAEMGGGDSRMMTDFARQLSRLIYFGGLIFIGCRIYRNKKLLKNRQLLKEQLLQEQDERNQYLHDKSGGIVMDVLLIFMLIITFTAALFDMGAFYTAAALLFIGSVLKGGAYLLYSRE